MESLVSIIITTYKGTDTIERAVKSVINQTYSDVEVIIVDDNEPDSDERVNTKEIISKYDGFRVIYIESSKHTNGACARNIGIRRASGEYIGFLDDDDIYCPRRIERCVSVLKENEKYHAVYTNVMLISDSLISSTVKAYMSGNLQKELILNKNLLGTGSNMFFSKKAIENIGFFDETFERHQDVEYMIRFFEKHEICALPEYLVIKVNNKGKSIQQIEKFIIAKRKFCSKFSRLIQNMNEDEYNQFVIREISELYEVGIRKYGSTKSIRDICREFAREYNRTLNRKIINRITIKHYLKKIFPILHKINHCRIILGSKEIMDCYLNIFKGEFV